MQKLNFGGDITPYNYAIGGMYQWDAIFWGRLHEVFPNFRKFFLSISLPFDFLPNLFVNVGSKGKAFKIFPLPPQSSSICALMQKENKRRLKDHLCPFLQKKKKKIDQESFRSRLNQSRTELALWLTVGLYTIRTREDAT